MAENNSERERNLTAGGCALFILVFPFIIGVAAPDLLWMNGMGGLFLFMIYNPISLALLLIAVIVSFAYWAMG